VLPRVAANESAFRAASIAANVVLSMEGAGYDGSSPKYTTGFPAVESSGRAAVTAEPSVDAANVCAAAATLVRPLKTAVPRLSGRASEEVTVCVEKELCISKVSESAASSPLLGVSS